jgi:hypothetical protein
MAYIPKQICHLTCYRIHGHSDVNQLDIEQRRQFIGPEGEHSRETGQEFRTNFLTTGSKSVYCRPEPSATISQLGQNCIPIQQSQRHRVPT